MGVAISREFRRDVKSLADGRAVWTGPDRQMVPGPRQDGRQKARERPRILVIGLETRPIDSCSKRVKSLFAGLTITSCISPSYGAAGHLVGKPRSPCVLSRFADRPCSTRTAWAR